MVSGCISIVLISNGSICLVIKAYKCKAAKVMYSRVLRLKFVYTKIYFDT